MKSGGQPGIYQRIFESLAPVRDQFYLRYYAWALSDAKREVSEGFRLLRKIKGTIAFSFIDFIEPLTYEERINLLTACVKRGHQRAVELTGNGYSVHEQQLLKRYLVAVSSFPVRERPKITRNALRKVLLLKLANCSFGEFDSWDLPNEWRYVRRLPRWIVETYIDVGGRGRQMAYRHVIKSSEEVPLCLDWISCMAWFGIATTDWNMLTEEDIPEAADDLMALCAHFLNAVPTLLQGLDSQAFPASFEI